MAASMNVQIFHWIHAGAGMRPVMDGFAVIFGEGGPYFLVVLFAVFWFFVSQKKKTVLLEATWAAIVGLLVNQLIGLFYFHPRPYMVGLCTPLFPHSPETSFPSDHATLMFAAAFYLLLGRCWAGCGIPLLTVSVLTAWGRVYSGIHFPADIAGSLAVGLMSVGLTRLLAKRIAPLHEKLIRIANQLTDRFGQTKNHGAREC